jgi:hypothetical protein
MKGCLKVQTTISKAQETKHNMLHLCKITVENATPMIMNVDKLQNHAQNIIRSNKIHTSDIGEQIQKTTIAQQMAEKAYNPTRVNTEEMIPPKFSCHKKVFSEQEAACFPPARPWDHKINLTNNALESINGKIYPLSQKITMELDKWINNMLERGFISVSSSRYGILTFPVAKKDGTNRIVR